jgi:hypothetical protein
MLADSLAPLPIVIKPSAELSIAPFRFDVTPPLGHSLLGGWIPPVGGYDDPLEAIGYVLLGAGEPIVVCALDWAGLMNGSHLTWRRAFAESAGTIANRVAIQCVHQHNAPLVCSEARAAAAQHTDLPEVFDVQFFQGCVARGQAAIRTALQRPRRVTHVAHGESTVHEVASNRRVARDLAGRVRAMRLSSCTDPELVALPEGPIDPMLQTIAFYHDDEKIVSCHYYATHPMSYYRDGRVSSDFCGLARKRRQREEPGCTHLYFTGCAGNVAAGKYNDGSPATRALLTQRVYDAITASDSRLIPEPLTTVDWRTVAVSPAARQPSDEFTLETAIADRGSAIAERLIAAFRLGWSRRVARGMPLELSCLRLNDHSVLHLPGEMFVEYQLRARALRPDSVVAVAASGDGGPWYVPTREEYANGGYEVSVAFCPEEIDELFTAAIARLLE